MSQALELNLQKDTWYSLLLLKEKLQSGTVPPGGPKMYGVDVATHIFITSLNQPIKVSLFR